MTKNNLVFVGSYTEDILFGTGQIYSGEGEGIYAFSFNETLGKLELLHINKEIRNPSFLSQHPIDNFLYAVNEFKEFEGEKSGAVSAFRVNKQTGTLDFINQVSSLGTDPCHLAIHKLGRFMFVANFANGTIGVGCIKEDGSLAPFHQKICHSGSSIDPIRQSGPHAHAINFSPCGDFIYVPDLGLDEVCIYRLNTEGYLEYINSVNTPQGGGPRQVIFHPTLDIAYIVCELSSQIVTCSYDPKNGNLKSMNTYTTLPSDFMGKSTCSEIQISHDGLHLYVSNRGHNSITIFNINTQTGDIKATGNIASGGEVPRHFSLDKSENWLAICNQETNNIVVKERLAPHQALCEIESAKSPVCILFSSWATND